tara:strand:+ start:24455 stop:25606 length:1152 start_codon:yes stop_codon:yes gene_type:complete
MKKILITAILVNTLILLTLSNIAKADHNGTEHKFNGISFSANGSENYQVLETDLVENKLTKFVDKQLENQDKTGLASYIVYTNGKIVINKNNWNDEIVKNNGMLRSNSMGKSLIAYVTGHAVCKYGLNLNKKLDDWVVIDNTLYEDNTLLQVLNMTSGDHNIVGEKKFRGDGFINGEKHKQVNNKTVAYNMIHFKNTNKEKENSPYNYSALSTMVAINYVIHKIGVDNYEKFLTEIFTDHVGVKNKVHFQKISWSKQDDDKGNSRYTFFATAEDYIRIANTLVKDYNSDTCIGDYLRTIYENRVNKNHKDYASKGVAAYTKQYGGQFHMGLIGMNDKVIFGLDGAGGQQIVIDMNSGTIVYVGSLDRHYNWKKLVYNVMKKGL